MLVKVTCSADNSVCSYSCKVGFDMEKHIKIGRIQIDDRFFRKVLGDTFVILTVTNDFCKTIIVSDG